MSTLKRMGLIFCLVFMVCPKNTAQETAIIIKAKVGVYISPPFVMKDSMGYFRGMAVDLWELIEDEVNIRTEYIEYNNWNRLMQALMNDDIEMAVSNISVTYDRAKIFKFSFPWYDSGLRIMVKTEGSRSIWGELRKNGHIQAYFWIVLAILLLTIILTIIHRKKDPEFPRGWIDGLAESLYRLILAIKTGVVNNENYTWVGKILAVTWMLCGIGLLAYVTSTITSSMTAVTLMHDIHSLNDLPGKKVGVLSGGIAESYLQNRSIELVSYETIEEVSEALMNDEIQAVVDDAPVLEYWCFNNPDKKTKVVGNIFHPDKFAFAANKNDGPLMDSVSVGLIKLFDIGKISEIRNNYFGNIH